MNKLKYLIVFIGLSVFANSCVEPEDPTNVQILTGEWEVKNVMANGQLNIPDDHVSGIFHQNSKLHLDKNDTFLFINVDGRTDAGTWNADENQLTLVKNNEEELVMEIVYTNYEKLHAYYTIESPVAGDIEIRYLFERIN